MATPQPPVVIGPVPENGIFEYVGNLIDETGAAIPVGGLSALKITLMDVITGTIINNKNGSNCLNLLGVTVDANGKLTYNSDPADSPIVQTRPGMDDGIYELHQGTFEWFWSANTKKNSRKFFVNVEKCVAKDAPIPAGGGPDLCSFFFQQSPGNPIPNMDVWVTSDIQGKTLVAGTLRTNSAGMVMFNLTNGNTYYLWTALDGFKNYQGQAIIVIKD